MMRWARTCNQEEEGTLPGYLVASNYFSTDNLTFAFVFIDRLVFIPIIQ